MFSFPALRSAMIGGLLVVGAGCATHVRPTVRQDAPSASPRCLAEQDLPANWNAALVGGRIGIWVDEHPGPAAAAAVLQAIDDWNGVRLPVRFVRVRAEREAAVRVRFIGRLPRSPGLDSPSGVTRLTIAQPPRLTAADVYLASQTPAGVPFSSTDLYVSAIHELGHALGVGHATESHLAMAASSRAVGFTPGDARLAREAYGVVARRCAPTTIAAGTR